MQTFSQSSEIQQDLLQLDSQGPSKRIKDIATLFEEYQLNNIVFEIKSHSYYHNLLLNGITFSLLDGKGQSQYIGFIRVIDSTSILIYNGVHLLDYSISGKTYKTIKQVNNLLFMAHHQQMYTGRIMVATLFKFNGNIHIEIVDFLSKKDIYNESLPALNPVKIVHFAINFQKKNYYLVIYQTQNKIFVYVKSIKLLIPAKILQLKGKVSNCHYNSDQNAQIFSRNNQLIILKQVGDVNNCVLEEKTILTYDQQIVFCKSYDNIVAFSTISSICIYHIDFKEKQVFQILKLIEEYSEILVPVTSLEFKNGIVLVAFQDISVIWQFTMNGEKVNFNFMRFQNIFVDPAATTALLVSVHMETQITGDWEQLNMGESNKIVCMNNNKNPYIKVSLLHLNILNTIYALQPLPWETYQYKAVLVTPWSNDYFLQTKHKIITQHWSYWIDQSICSAIHPTSLFMAIGFRDCFKIFAILSDGLHYTNSGVNLRQCTSLCYSNSGNHLAVSSGNNIYIYNSYSYQRIHTIPQIQNSSVKQLRYDSDFLLSKLKNGNCFLYSISNNYNKILAFYPKDFLVASDKNIPFDFVEYDSVYDIFIVSWNGFIKFYINKGTLELLSTSIGCIATMCYICRQLKTMFIGTNTGQVISFPWPNNPAGLRYKQPRKKVHQHPIQFIRIKSDYRQLLIISNTGVVYIGKLKIVSQLRQIKAQQIHHQNINRISMTNVLRQSRLMFHSHSVHQSLQFKIQQLSQQINNDYLIHPIEYSKIGATRLKRQKQNLLLKNNNQVHDLNTSHALYRLGIRQTRQKIQQFQDKINDNTQIISKEYSRKHKQLIDKRYQLQKTQLSIIQQHKKQLKTLKQQYQSQYNLLEFENSTMLNKIVKSTNKSNTDFVNNISLYSEQNNQFEQDNEQHKNKQINPFITDIQMLNYNNLDMIVKNSKLKRDIMVLEMKIKDLKEPLGDLEIEIASYNPKVVDELNQQQQNITKISNNKMKEKQYLFMKAVKETLSMNKFIEVSSSTHKMLIEEVGKMEDKIQQIDQKTYKIQEDIVGEKAISVKNSKIQKGLITNLANLKNKRKQIKESAFVSNVQFQRQVQNLAIALKENRIKQMMKFSQQQRMKTDLPQVQVTQRTSSRQKPQRCKTQLRKITRALYAHQRVGNTITNMKKIYNNHSIRAYDQNQDLIQHWNSLRLERQKYRKRLNKTMQNVDNLPQQSKQINIKKTKKNTPFQQYISRKQQKKKIGLSLCKVNI